MSAWSASPWRATPSAFIPPAFAAWMPAGASSTTQHCSGATPSSLAAIRNRSGAGLPRAAWPDTSTANENPARRSSAGALREELAAAIGMPASRSTNRRASG